MPHDHDRLVAILSYGTPVGWVVALILHERQRSELGLFHLRQALGLYLTSIVLGWVPLLGWLILLALLALWALGLVGAIRREREPVPVVGPWYQHFLGALR